VFVNLAPVRVHVYPCGGRGWVNESLFDMDAMISLDGPAMVCGVKLSEKIGCSHIDTVEHDYDQVRSA
jgi:hypothetical protein